MNGPEYIREDGFHEHHMAKINGMNVDLYLVLRVYRQDDFSEVAQHKCLACCVTNIMDEFGDSGLLPNSTGYSHFKHRSQHRGALSSIGSMMPIQQSMHDYNMTLSPLGPTPSLSSSLIIFVFLPFSSLVWAISPSAAIPPWFFYF